MWTSVLAIGAGAALGALLRWLLGLWLNALLPALPKAWANGAVKGLRARGGYEVDLDWQAGNLTSATLRNVSGDGLCKVRLGGKVVELKVPRGKARKLDENLAIK